MATFFEIGLEMQLGKDNQLMKIHRLIKWERLRGYLKKVRKTDPVTGGREGYDETTLCRFRNRLIELKLDKTLMRMVNQELSRLGIEIEKAKGAIIDATIIASSARPEAEEMVVMDREEETPSNTGDQCQCVRNDRIPQFHSQDSKP